MAAAARLPMPVTTTWSLTELEVDLMVDIRNTLAYVQRLIDANFGEPGRLSEQIKMLDLRIGMRGMKCEVPRPC